MGNDEKIKLTAGQARKTRCYHPQAPFGVVVVEKFEKRMMNFNELADYIGLRPQTIRNKFYAGEFPIPGEKNLREGPVG